MTVWTIEIMMYRPKGSRHKIEIGRRLSRDGGKTWIEDGKADARFEDTYTKVRRVVSTAEYQERIKNPKVVTVAIPIG
ncbi:hypothetical protein ACRQ5Q_22170 [Bradyrhizobium sp. PMVTL-01]|uniref:hypothetical protein n=1 Tax=Bradyrhizobium sp. PMVTL-01 TaxID=3434999 RepID=UPI003F72EA6B